MSSRRGEKRLLALEAVPETEVDKVKKAYLESKGIELHEANEDFEAPPGCVFLGITQKDAKDKYFADRIGKSKDPDKELVDVLRREYYSVVQDYVRNIYRDPKTREEINGYEQIVKRNMEIAQLAASENRIKNFMPKQ